MEEALAAYNQLSALGCGTPAVRFCGRRLARVSDASYRAAPVTDMLRDHGSLSDERRQVCYEAQSRATDRLTRLVESLLVLAGWRRARGRTASNGAIAPRWWSSRWRTSAVKF